MHQTSDWENQVRTQRTFYKMPLHGFRCSRSIWIDQAIAFGNDASGGLCVLLKVVRRWSPAISNIGFWLPSQENVPQNSQCNSYTFLRNSSKHGYQLADMIVSTLLPVEKYYFNIDQQKLFELAHTIYFIHGGKPFISPQTSPSSLTNFRELKCIQQQVSRVRTWLRQQQLAVSHNSLRTVYL